MEGWRGERGGGGSEREVWEMCMHTEIKACTHSGTNIERGRGVPRERERDELGFDKPKEEIQHDKKTGMQILILLNYSQSFRTTICWSSTHKEQ